MGIGIARAPGKGAWETESDDTLTAAVTDQSFTGLDLDTDGVYKLYFTIANTAGATAIYDLEINGDTTAANYPQQQFVCDGATVSGARSAGLLRFCTAPAGQEVTGEVTFMKDGATDFVRYWTVTNQEDAGGMRFINRSHLWESGANMVSMKVRSDQANGVGIGSRFILLKRTGD